MNQNMQMKKIYGNSIKLTPNNIPKDLEYGLNLMPM